MNPGLLAVLECPYCGWALQPDGNARNVWRGGAMTFGVLHCQCCTYPVVDGIPFIQTGGTAQEALRLVHAGEGERALVHLLGADGVPRTQLEPLLRDDPGTTFREALELLSRDAEGSYLLYRFSDPTYLASKALLDAVGQDERCWSRRVLDIGGGAGHLTRALCTLNGGGDVVLADITYWKLWLAKRFIAPCCHPVCCDANQSLPFRDGEFSFVFCSDAFHYIWARRSLASNMLQLAGSDGVVVLAHLHNAMTENPSAGMPLDPAGYRHLFRDAPSRLLGERTLLDAAVDGGHVDLAIDVGNDALASEPALALVASRRAEVFRRYAVPRAGNGPGRRSLNPLYRREADGTRTVLRRRFPTDFYELEFGVCKQYLPEMLQAEEAHGQSAPFVLLELPERYT